MTSVSSVTRNSQNTPDTDNVLVQKHGKHWVTAQSKVHKAATIIMRDLENLLHKERLKESRLSSMKERERNTLLMPISNYPPPFLAALSLNFPGFPNLCQIPPYLGSVWVFEQEVYFSSPNSFLIP